MRLWIILTIIILSIIFGGIYLERSILKTTDEISSSLTLLEERVDQDRWSDATTLALELADFWGKQKEMWVPFVHNQELDLISLDFANLNVLVESQRKDDILERITELKLQLVQLHHREVLTLKNIF